MNYLLTLVVALAGSLVFQLLHLPIPWLLGSLVFVFTAQFFTKLPLTWDIRFRNTGLMIVGFSMGHIFTLAVLKEIVLLFPYLFMFNIVLLLFSILMAYLIHIYCKLPFSTMVVANVPGGLSQMILFAEETKRMDVSIVTYFQVVRVFLVVLTIPFLVLLFSDGGTVLKENASLSMKDGTLLGILFVFSPLAVALAKRLFIPVPYFVGPLLYVLLISLAGISVPEMPITIVHIAQLCIGTYVGLLLKREHIFFSRRIVVMGIVSTMCLIAFTFVISWQFHFWLDETVITLFLALAPGGLDQMGIVAASMNENVAIVTIFQLFRMLFVFLIVIPLLSYLEKKQSKRLEENERTV